MYPKYTVFFALRLYSNRTILNINIQQILDIIHVVRSTLYQWIKLYAHDSYFNDFNFAYHKRSINRSIRQSKLNDISKQYIIKYITNNPTFNMKKLRNKIYNLFFINVSKSTIYRLFKSNKLTYKKVQTNKYRKSEDMFIQEKHKLKLQITKTRRNIISIDETSIELGLRQTKGWALKGSRCLRKSTIKRQRYSLVLAINKTKVIGFQLVKGSFNGESFKTFITDKIIPKSKKASLLMDNARIHHYRKFTDLMNEDNVNIIYNIPYSPQFNPIEYVFNVLKTEIRNSSIDSYKQLYIKIQTFVKKMNSIGFHNYFQKSYTDLFN